MDPCGVFFKSYQQDKAIIRTGTQWILLFLFIVLMFLLPMFLDRYWISVFNNLLIIVIVVIGMQLVTGVCGQISLGQAAFAAVGAYITAILAKQLAFPFWLAMISAGVGASAIGLIFGLPSLRVKGFYLTLATVAAQIIIVYALQNLPGTGGTAGLDAIPKPTIGAFAFDTDERFYILSLIVTIIMVFLATNVIRSKIGRAWIAIRDNDLAASAMGVSVFRYKVMAFGVSAFFAGIAGALWAYSRGAVHPDQFTLTDSIWYMGMMIVGGMGSITGAIMGATFLHLLQTLVTQYTSVLTLIPGVTVSSSAAWAQLFFGIVIIAFLIFEPRGLFHRWQLFKSYYRLWPFAY